VREKAHQVSYEMEEDFGGKSLEGGSEGKRQGYIFTTEPRRQMRGGVLGAKAKRDFLLVLSGLIRWVSPHLV